MLTPPLLVCYWGFDITRELDELIITAVEGFDMEFGGYQDHHTRTLADGNYSCSGRLDSCSVDISEIH